MALIGSTIQIVIAVALVIVLCAIAFVVFNAEMLRAIKESGRVKRELPIFVGVKDLAVSKNEAYNTVDPLHPMYRNIESSVNQKAGAEYTYNFWLYMDSSKLPPVSSSSSARSHNATDVGLTQKDTNRPLSNKPLVLLLRGDKNAVAFKNICNEPNSTASNLKVDVLVKQPMIKLEQNYDVMTIELNTQNKPDPVKEKSRNTCKSTESDWGVLNSYRIGVKNVKDKLAGSKWNMVTLVVQDTFPSDPLPMRNKVRVRLFVNGTMEIDTYVDGKLADTSSDATLLRPNNGSLYVAPIITAKLNPADGNKTSLSAELGTSNESTIMMADLTYFNYAIDVVQLKGLFDAGFNKRYAPSMTVNTTNISPLSRDKADITADRNLTVL